MQIKDLNQLDAMILRNYGGHGATPVTVTIDPNLYDKSYAGREMKLMGRHFYGGRIKVTVGDLNDDGTYAGTKTTVPVEWVIY